jgi:hypothetical protein
VTAILLATEKLLEFTDWKIVIHSDSQAALHVLNNKVVMSKMVLVVMLNLNTLAESRLSHYG